MACQSYSIRYSNVLATVLAGGGTSATWSVNISGPAPVVGEDFAGNATCSSGVPTGSGSPLYVVITSNPSKVYTVDATASPTNGNINTITDYPSPTPTPTRTQTPTRTITPTVTPTITPTKTITPTLTPTPSITPTITPTSIVSCDGNVVWETINSATADTYIFTTGQTYTIGKTTPGGTMIDGIELPQFYTCLNCSTTTNPPYYNVYYNRYPGITDFNFSPPIENPILAFYSLGAGLDNQIFSANTNFIDYAPCQYVPPPCGSANPSAPIYDFAARTIEGFEAFGAIMFPGTHSSITLQAIDTENRTNFLWGLPCEYELELEPGGTAGINLIFSSCTTGEEFQFLYLTSYTETYSGLSINNGPYQGCYERKLPPYTGITIVDLLPGLYDYNYTLNCAACQALVTPSPTVTPTFTPTPSITPTLTPSITPTITISPTNTITPTSSITPTGSITPTASVSATPGGTPSTTPTITITPTTSITPTSSITPTGSITPTSSVSATPGGTPSTTPTITITPTTSITPTSSITPTGSITPTSSVSATPVGTPSTTPTITITPSVTPSITFSPTTTPTPSSTPIPVDAYSGVTSGITWSYYDACGNYYSGTSYDTPICVDINQPFDGILIGVSPCDCGCQCTEIDIDPTLIFVADGQEVYVEYTNCTGTSTTYTATTIDYTFNICAKTGDTITTYFYISSVLYSGDTYPWEALPSYFVDRTYLGVCSSDPCNAPLVSPTPTPSVSVTVTETPTLTPTTTPSVSVGASPTLSPTPTPTPTPSVVIEDCDRLTNPNFEEFATCGGPCTGNNCLPPSTFRFYPQECIPGWSTTDPGGIIEIWKSGYLGYSSYNGSYFAEINASAITFQSLYQTFTITTGQTYQVQFAHMGRSGFPNTLRVALSGETSGINFIGNDPYTANIGEWTFNTINHTFDGIYSTDTEYNLMFSAVTATNGGNFLDAINVVCPSNFISEDLTYTFSLSGLCDSGVEVPNSGIVTIFPSGGVPPYSLECDSGQDIAPVIDIPEFSGVTFANLSGDTYIFRLNDSLGGYNGELFINVNIDSCYTAQFTTVTDTTCGLENGQLVLSATTTSLPLTVDLYLNGSVYSSGDYNYLPITFTDLPEGSYSAITYDFGGAFYEISTAVTIGSSYELDFVMEVTQNANCGGFSTGSIQLSGLTGGPYTYLWSDLSTGATISGLSAGTYSVTVTDNYGCELTKSTTVTNASTFELLFAAATQPGCLSSDGEVTIYVSGGTSPYVYSGETGQIASGITATSYTMSGVPSGDFAFLVYDSNLCFVGSSVQVVQEGGLVSVSTSVVPTNCGSYGNLQIFVEGTGAPYVYGYTGQTNGTSSTYSSNVSNHTFLNLSADTYDVSVTTSNGCVWSDTVTVSSTPKFELTISTTGATCGSNNGVVTIEVGSGYTGVLDYVISEGYSIIDTSLTSYTFNNLSAGNYNVTVTDADGCSIYGDFSISTTGSLSYAVNKTNCVSGGDGTATVVIYEGNPPFTYSWSNGETGSTVNSLSGGTYTVTVEDSSGCTQTKFFTITCTSSIVSGYELYPIDSNVFVTTVGNQRGLCEMLNEGFYDLTTGYTSSTFVDGVFSSVVSVTGYTSGGTEFTSGSTEYFYTATTLNDCPSDYDYVTTLQNQLESIEGVGNVTFDLLTNTFTVSSSCDGTYDPFKNGKIDTAVNIDYNFNYNP